MFQTEYETLKDSLSLSEGNYVLQKRDLIELQVYTSKGELIIDPNFQLRKELGNANGINNQQRILYLIKEDGYADLPMIGEVELVNLTLDEAKEKVEKKYSVFYKNSFVVLRISNRRVIVLGAAGERNVIRLENEKMTLLEILALSGGINRNSKAYNIRIIRGDLKDPHVQIVDLSTIEGMKKANLEVYPNDVIYIEPVRRVVFESLKDASPILSFVTTVISLGILIVSLNNN